MVRMIETFLEGIFTFHTSAINSLDRSLESFSIYDVVSNISEMIAIPVAMVVLAICFATELYEVSLSYDGTKSSMSNSVNLYNRLIIMVLIVFTIQHTTIILDAIYEIGTWIINQIDIVVATAAVDTAEYARQIKEELHFFEQMVATIILMLIWIVSGLIELLVSFAIFARMFNIFTMMAYAPIPLAFFASNEHKQTCYSFIKKFAGEVFHGVMLMTMLYFANTFLITYWSSNSISGNWLTGSIQLLCSMIVIGMVVFGAKKTSDTLVGAM